MLDRLSYLRTSLAAKIPPITNRASIGRAFAGLGVPEEETPEEETPNKEGPTTN